MLHKLNIVMSYPVQWTVYNIMNNFIQNFYDALGRENFKEGFSYTYEDGTLTFNANTGFSKEWLFYIGASTKRKEKGRYAGGFGEGFKIAALVAMRDYGAKIYMASRDWQLNVTTVPGEINLEGVRMLAYDITERAYEESSVLCISGVDDDFYSKTEYALNSFLYDGNPILGKLLLEGTNYAIYEPAEKKNGRLFACYEFRGSLSFPLIVCNHTFKTRSDDRDRSVFDDPDIVDAVEEVFDGLGGKESLLILEHMKNTWSPFSGKHRYYKQDWGRAIRILVSQVCGNKEARDLFIEKYASSIIIPDRKRSTNKSRVAAVWFRPYREKYQYVRSSFAAFGINTVSELCEKNGGNLVERDPDEKERWYIALLEKAARCVLGDLLCPETLPQCRILINEEAPWQGYTMVNKRAGGKNPYGLKVRAKADHVCLKAGLFVPGCFAEAFTTYSHELLHQFGGDASLQFHKALALMNEKIIHNSLMLEKLKEEWETNPFVNRRGK